MHERITKIEQEKSVISNELSHIEAKYKAANRDQGVSDMKIKDLEEQLEQRSQFEHQIIQKLEDISEKYKAQNDLLKDIDLLNLDLKKENEDLYNQLHAQKQQYASLQLELKLFRESNRAQGRDSRSSNPSKKQRDGSIHQMKQVKK